MIIPYTELKISDNYLIMFNSDELAIFDISDKTTWNSISSPVQNLLKSAYFIYSKSGNNYYNKIVNVTFDQAFEVLAVKTDTKTFMNNYKVSFIDIKDKS